jgi:hypothetical protein
MSISKKIQLTARVNLEAYAVLERQAAALLNGTVSVSELVNAIICRETGTSITERRQPICVSCKLEKSVIEAPAMDIDEKDRDKYSADVVFYGHGTYYIKKPTSKLVSLADYMYDGLCMECFKTLSGITYKDKGTRCVGCDKTPEQLGELKYVEIDKVSGICIKCIRIAVNNVGIEEVLSVEDEQT